MSVPWRFDEMDQKICEVMKNFPSLYGYPQFGDVLNQTDSNTMHIVAQYINAHFGTNLVGTQIYNRWKTLKRVFFAEFEANGHSVRGYRGSFHLFYMMTYLVNGEQGTGRV